KHRCALEHHAAREHGDFAKTATAERANRGVECGGENTLIFGKQVIGEFVEGADAPDHGRARDDVVAFSGQLSHAANVLGVPLDEGVPWMVVIALAWRSVLAEVVKAQHFVAGL